MARNMIANKYYIGSGKGSSFSPLVSFDKALLDAGVGNYNLVRLSSILPAKCEQMKSIDLKEGSLLPIAYATISSDVLGDILYSGVMVGFSDDQEKVGVIMEYSEIGATREKIYETLLKMVQDAFKARGWTLKGVQWSCAHGMVQKNGETMTTFACIAEWE